MSLSEYQQKIIDRVSDCAVIGVNYYHTRAWQNYNVAIAPGLFFAVANNKGGDQVVLEMVSNHNLVCDYLDFIIQKYTIMSEEYRSCWWTDHSSVEWLEYLKVLDKAREWANAGGRKKWGELI